MFIASHWPWFQFTANDGILRAILMLVGIFEVCHETLNDEMLFLFDFVILNQPWYNKLRFTIYYNDFEMICV